jgi:hypothetical protein
MAHRPITIDPRAILTKDERGFKCQFPSMGMGHFDTGTGPRADTDCDVERASIQTHVVIPGVGHVVYPQRVHFDIAWQETVAAAELRITIRFRFADFANAETECRQEAEQN